MCREFLKRVPSSVEGMRLLASIGSRLGVLDDADFLLASAIKFAPDNIQLRIDYIQILRKRQQFLPALEQAKTLLSSAPENPQFQSIYAVESMQTGDFDIALEYFEKVLKQLPGDPVTLTSRGHALKTNGSFQQAVASYQEAINSQSQYGEAYYALANLKTYRFTEIEIEQMLVQDKNPDLLHQDRIFICFALGKAYEDQADYKQSFSYYERGNQLKLAQSRYKRAQMTDELSAQIDVCTESLFKRHRLSGCLAADPIFVVGLPRSGSTLLEQILSSHSQVDGTMELPNIMSLSHKLRRGGTLDGVSKYPEVLSKMDPDQLRSFGESYISDTLIHRDGAPFFIDKMPNNFRHIGLIKLILPNAKIIDARRHPLACCFSAYKQLFAEGQEFTYGLEEVGNYYRDYVQLMAHWDKVLPGFVLRVQHEEVVADLEHQVARLLDFCGLPFEESCLRFFETKRKIRTPSSEQVRQPIYNDALEQWRNFEEYLQPLKQALGSEIMMPELTAANK
ncbi:MAG: tetratricopeptide (TPR) repeat protein [Candidatus Azotimanducaceae bacterium]